MAMSKSPKKRGSTLVKGKKRTSTGTIKEKKSNIWPDEVEPVDNEPLDIALQIPEIINEDEPLENFDNEPMDVPQQPAPTRKSKSNQNSPSPSKVTAASKAAASPSSKAPSRASNSPAIAKSPSLTANNASSPSPDNSPASQASAKKGTKRGSISKKTRGSTTATATGDGSTSPTKKSPVGKG